jgi:drug/metabolite transporter (DMT)-like permease
VAILSFFILNEELGTQKIVGIMVVVAGLFLAQIKRKRRKPELELVEVHDV